MTSIATFSYALAALAFCALGLVLVTGWRSRTYAGALALACGASAAWGAALAWHATTQSDAAPWMEALEIARNAAWSAFLVIIVGNYRQEGSRLPWSLAPSIAGMALFYLAFFIATLCGLWHHDALAKTGLMPGVVARVGLSVWGMLLVEQLYRNKTAQERWAIKFACLGIGAMFAYDFYMYSDTMLFHEINADIWAARGVVNALTAPLIALSMARSASWAAGLALSRRVMFHSAALFGSAVYLLAMGSAGYYLRYVGGRWGTVMQVAFLFGAVILLVVILFSGAFRAWLKVFISKHFYRYNYDYREEWMRFTRTLSEHGPNLGERAVHAVAELVESPGGVLWLARETGQFEQSAHLHAPVTGDTEPLDGSLARFLESKQWVIDLEELRAEPELYADLALPGWLARMPRAWLVVPLVMHARLAGFVVLLEPRSQIKLNWEVIDLLKIAGSQAASYLAQQEAANALMVARQFESFNRMSTFVVHDLKNLVSQLSLLIPNAEKHRDNPEFQRDMLDTVNHSVHKMKLLLQKLSRSESLDHPMPLELDQVLRNAVALKGAFVPHPVLEIQAPGLKVMADRERLERVLGHLIQNAIEATPRDGSVTIRLWRDDSAQLARIEIRDTGEGMTDEFIRERLFKPFETTKSAGMGIGVFESREYIRELGGSMDVHSTPSVGTTFNVSLPLPQVNRGAGAGTDAGTDRAASERRATL
ncbi:MAG: XrtA/PEP-CTERM system histidine kinase PrsK [Gammaproteobacteria bacterium]